MTSKTHPRLAAGIRRTGAAILLAVALGAVGCSDDPAAPSVPATYDHAASTTAGGLRLTASTVKATYEFGEDVRIRITMTNVSDETQVLDFSRGNPARFPNIGLNVDDADGAAHFVAGDGDRDDFPLAPGEAISADFTWNQNTRFGGDPVERGFYSVVAFVGFDDRAQLRVDDLFIELD